MSGNYGDAHKNFLRLMMAKSLLSENEAMRCMQIYANKGSLGKFIEEINEIISPYDQKLKVVSNELTGKTEVVFLWISDPSLSQTHTIFTAADVQYLKLLLERMIFADDKNLSEINCLNVAAGVTHKPFSMDQANKLLDDWCGMHYFAKRKNNYYLGSRGVHEFQAFFKRNYPEVVKECAICNLLAFYFLSCPECPVVFHTYCLSDLRKTAKLCPNCKSDLSQMDNDI